MKNVLRAVLRFFGKGETKVVAVFGFDPTDCDAAVRHVRQGASALPVWLFCQTEPLPETRLLCQSVHVVRSSPQLVYRAVSALWPWWVALTVATWTGGRGHWLWKLAPFLIPPFRALILNDHGDFFAGKPTLLWRHFLWRLREARRGARSGLRDARVLTSWLLVRLLSCLYGCFLPERPLFARIHGRQWLSLTALPAEGRGFLRISGWGTQWRAAELERRLEESTARWLLWCEQDPPAGIHDWESLFADHRTFAVSLQSGFRGWKPLLFSSAPFRALQKGEVSQVLAPLSPVLLVDRQKLLALGIPRCSIPGAAWMILFWKAAAAGWRSYSVGCGTPTEELPDLPVQETSFLLHFLADGNLRRLGPSEPDLSNGSIAFPLSRRQAASGRERLKVLLVSPFLPYPLSHGGAVRMFNLCRALATRVDFILIAIREQHDVVDYGRLQEVFREVYVVDKDELPAIGDDLPEQVRRHESAALRALIAEVTHRWQPDLLQVEYTHLAPVRTAAPRVPAILVEHDLTFSLYRQLAEKSGGLEAQQEYRRWYDFERQWLKQYEGVWTVSEEDRQTAIREAPRPADRTFHIANGVDIRRFAPSEESGAAEILYVGSFRHLPNIIGFENLRDHVMEAVWRQSPDARLVVVAGPDPLGYWKHFGRSRQSPQFDPRVEIHGFVEDLRPLYGRASVVAVPLEVSAGTNIKVLEAMACGKAIVSTSVGCAGLGLRDGEHLAIRDGWQEFAAAIAGLLPAPARRARLGAEARREAERQFSWDAIADEAFESYGCLLGQPEVSPDRVMWEFEAWDPVARQTVRVPAGAQISSVRVLRDQVAGPDCQPEAYAVEFHWGSGVYRCPLYRFHARAVGLELSPTATASTTAKESASPAYR